MASATSWLKNTFLDFFIGAEVPVDSPPATQSKRKASEDGQGRLKFKRPNHDVCWGAQYGSPGPSRPRERQMRYKDSGEITRARRSVEYLKRHVSREPNPLLTDAPEQPREHSNVGISTSKLVGKLTLTGKQESLEGLESSDEEWDVEEDWQPVEHHRLAVKQLPRSQTSPQKANIPETTKSPTMIKPATASKCSSSATDTPWDPRMDNTDRWATRPNKLAREILDNNPQRARQAIQEQVKEPEYALRDVEIRDGLWHIMNLMERLNKQFFGGNVRKSDPSGRELLRECFEQLTPETAKIIGCVASGGPEGERGWERLFDQPLEKRALVSAIIGNVLVEQVFQHIFFGGTVRHIAALTELQRTHKDADGFDRNRHYAVAVSDYLHPDPKTNTYTLPANFSNHVAYITGAIWTHLKPILHMDIQLLTTHPNTQRLLTTAIQEIVTHAGLLSLCMRLDPHTVYYFEPLFKEDTFDPTRMECFNQTTMEQTNPRTPDSEPRLTPAEKSRRALISPKEKIRAKLDDPVTQIALLNGLTAYRRGGWENHASSLGKRVYESREFADKGVRSRVLTHAWVHCRWGRARRFGRGNANDDSGSAIHGAAWKGGFIEFTACAGVVDWLGEERREKGIVRGGGWGSATVGVGVGEEDVQKQLLGEAVESADD